MKFPHFNGGTRSSRLLPIAIPAVFMMVVALAAVFNARRVLTRATQASANEGQLPFTLRILDPSSTRAQNLGFEPVASTPDYTVGAFFAGDLYVAGPSGLSILNADGTARLNLRAGYELPVAPIVSITSARLRGTSEPQLLMATSGAGLLIFGSNFQTSPTVHQLLPAVVEDRDLTALAALSTGDLLLGTRNHGVLLYNGVSLTPVRFLSPGVNPAALEITALAAIDSSSFLIGTRNSGIFYLHGGTVAHADSTSGLPDDEVESIAIATGSGGASAFVGTPVGTVEFNLAASSFHPARILGRGLFSHALAVDGRNLTIGTLDQGIRQIPLENQPYLRRASIAAGPDVVSAQRVDAFLTAPDALYAIANGALLRSMGTGWEHIVRSSTASLTDRNIAALAFGADGTLYVGYFDHGIDLIALDGEIHHFEDDHLFCINRLALDPQRHTVDAATANGLVLFDAQGIPRQIITRRDGLISDHVTDIDFTRTGTALATPAGITFIEPSGTESLYAFQGLVNNHVYALANAASGELLAGTLGGISILRSNKVQRNLTITNSALSHNWITALLPMPDSKVLVGTYGAGLEALDSEGNFSPIELPAGTPRDLVINPNAVYATSSHLYAGTLGHGLLVYSLASNRWSAIVTGLPSLNVTAFAARDGELYVGTENGLVRIPEATLQ
jgi:ligand-binding sensor domain-containing protein